MSIFSKLFKRNKVNTEALGLINLNSFIVYPDKSFYEEKENKKLYRNFADSYKEILSTHKTITSKSLNLSEEINVKLYTEIINKLLIELDYTVDLINNSPERNSVNIKILYLKLRHYQNEINNYKNEVFIKLKVLNELHKKYIFSKNKREAIKSEITNLEMNIVMCQNNFNALNMEINSYSSIINYSELKEVDEEEYLSKRSKKLEKYMNAYGLNYKSDTSISGLIANELTLEEYLFTNKNEILKSISEGKNNYLNKLEIIDSLIYKYSALVTYMGTKNLEQDLNKLFKEKYDYLFDRNISNYIDYMTDLDEIYFEAFVSSDIARILNGDFIIYMSQDYHINKKEEIRILNLLKDFFFEEGVLNPKEILRNNIKMKVLNNYKDGNICGNLLRIITDSEISREECDKDLLCLDLLTWPENIFLIDYIRLINYYVLYKSHDFNEHQNNAVEIILKDKGIDKTLCGKLFLLYNAYHPMQMKKTRLEYNSAYLFKNLIAINDFEVSSQFSIYVLKYLLKLINHKQVRLGKNFAEFKIGEAYIYDPDPTPVKDKETLDLIPFNFSHKNLKEITLGYDYTYIVSKNITIPSNVEKFKFTNIKNQNITFVFEDLEDSKLFRDHSNFYSFLCSVIKSKADTTIWFLSKYKDFRFDINVSDYKNLKSPYAEDILRNKIYEEFRIRKYDIDYLINSRELIKTKKVLKEIQKC